jgi:hypothetical protein
MFIELNEAQLKFAFDKEMRIHTVERGIMPDGCFAFYGAWVNAPLDDMDIEKSIKRLSVFYMHKNEYDQLPAEMRAISSPEPNGEPDYQALALLLIDLYEEKIEIENKIAAVKAMLQK